MASSPSPSISAVQASMRRRAAVRASCSRPIWWTREPQQPSSATTTSMPWRVSSRTVAALIDGAMTGATQPVRSATRPRRGEIFDQAAPPGVRGFAPPFLAPSIQPGGLQVWTGCIAKTAPGWSLLVRGVANLSQSLSYHMLEGIIETDNWFGPLFDNVRILKTDIPVEFRSDVPFLQVQPVRKDFYADKFLQSFAVKELGQLSPDNWEAFHRTVVVPNTSPERKRGQYAASVRKQAAHATARPSMAE